jgi:hypothetical protein
MALPSWLLVSVGGRRSQRPGPSPTLVSLGPFHHWRHKSRVSLRGPPCALGVSSIPFGEVRNSWAYNFAGKRCFIKWYIIAWRQRWTGMSWAFKELYSISPSHQRFYASRACGCTTGSALLCVWREEMSCNNVIVRPLSTWMAHGMFDTSPFDSSF